MAKELWENLCSEDNLYRAWIKVAANMGAGGIDKVSIEDFQLNLQENLTILKNLLKEGEYRPLPLLNIRIDKSLGGKRILGIPAIRDRIVQQALVNVLQPRFESIFLDCSYGYRPGRSAHQALNKIEKYIRKGNYWILDADIESFFDNVEHSLLVNFIRGRIDEELILDLISSILQTGASVGIAQGAVTSPLFANIYLHQMDKKLTQDNYNLVRYADDFVVLTKTEPEVKKILDEVRKILQDDLRLKLNEVKTRVCHLKDRFVFLGYEFDEKGRRPSQKALREFLIKLHRETKPQESKIDYPDFQRERLRSIIRGWLNYFKLDVKSHSELIKKLTNISQTHPESIPAKITMAASYIDSGEPEKAKSIVTSRPEFSSDDHQIHYQWGILCRELGMMAEAKDEFLTAFKLNPDHRDTTYNLGLLCLKEDKIQRAIQYLQKTIQIDPEFAPAHYLLGRTYKKWGLHGIAKRSFEQACTLDSQMMSAVGEELAKKESTFEFDLGAFTQKDLKRFLQLFSGREGVYARQWVNNTGKWGYSLVKDSLTEREVRAHLEGDLTLGLYLTRADNTVKLMVIDIDVNKSIIMKSTQDKEIGDTLISEIQKEARKIKSLADELGISVYIEDSGYKGRHLWFFFAEPVKASETRNLAKAIIKRVGEPPEGIHREIFPKQDRIASDALGCLIKLPLGIHKGAGRRSLFIDIDGRVYDNQILFLQNIKQITEKEVREAIRILQTGFRKEIFKEVENAKIEKILEGCRVIKFLVNKAKEKGHLTHSERLVLLYSLGHLSKEGKQYIHQTMSNCLNYDFNYTQRWINRLQATAYPISCPKIRDWLSDITPVIGCYCEFDLPVGAYPSPLLFVDSKATSRDTLNQKKVVNKETKLIPESTPEKETATAELPLPLKQSEKTLMETSSQMEDLPPIDNIDTLINQYVDLKNSKKALDEELKQCEAKLNALFDSKATDSLSCRFGILKRTRTHKATLWRIDL